MTRQKVYTIQYCEKKQKEGEPLSQTAYRLCKASLLKKVDVKEANERGKAVFNMNQRGDNFVMTVTIK